MIIKKLKPILTLVISLSVLALSSQTGIAASFDGPYAGLTIGVGSLKQEGSILSGPFKDKSSSALLGGILGIRTSVGDANNFIIGIESDLNYYFKGDKWRYGVSAIAGYKVTDNSLIFLKGGYGKRTNNGDSLDGALYGAGLEFAINQALNLRIEYKKLRYGEVNFSDNMIRSNGDEGSAALIYSF